MIINTILHFHFGKWGNSPFNSSIIIIDAYDSLSECPHPTQEKLDIAVAGSEALVKK